jgi:general secretion pathway protein D/MSHA biogenesis protein MshL
LTATVLNNNEIIMNLVPVTSELQGEIEYRAVGEGEVGLPVVNVREMSTTVRVKDGEMLVIGGLISDVNEDVGNFAPVVGDIPLVKYLFGYEEKIKHKRELIILLKPRII